MSKLPCKLIEKKQIRMLAVLGWMIYFSSYITRINYGAMITEMVADTGFAKSLLSMAVTGSFITYGTNHKLYIQPSKDIEQDIEK